MSISLLGFHVPYWSVAGVLTLVVIARILEWVWFSPKRLEKILRQQGIRGNPYKLFSPDVKDSIRMSIEARAKPLPLYSHDVAPRVVPFLVKIKNDYGKNSLSWFGTTPRLIIGDPELIRQIVSSKFTKKQNMSSLSKYVVSGLLSYEGEKWSKHRKIINPAFHLEKLKCMLPAFSACCKILIERWDKLVGSEGTKEVNIWPELQDFTGDVISRTAFGNSSKEEGKRVFQLQTEQAGLVIQGMRYAFIPGYSYLPTKDNKRREQIEKEVRSILRTMIERREKSMREGTRYDDLLGYLMESNFVQLQEHGNSKTFGMTTEEVIDECKLFYVAGQETTSVLLTWTMILLAMYPSWQDRAREEVQQAFGKDEPSFDAVNRLKIVTMVLYEVLRLYPPVASIVRDAPKKIELGEFTIPQGVRFLLPNILVHHDPDYWGEDVLEFNPERFSEGVSKASKHPLAFFPFGGGPRVCVGQAFSMIEAKLALSMILQRFSFQLSPSYIHAPSSVLTLQPQHGAQIMFDQDLKIKSVCDQILWFAVMLNLSAPVL